MKLQWLILLCLAAVPLSATPLWENNLKVRSSTALEWNQASARISGNGFLAVWSDTHADTRDIYVQRVNGQGNPVWAEPRAVDNKPGFQKNPVLARTSDGYYMVAWIDTYARPIGDIRIQKIDSEAQILWQTGGIPVTDNVAYKYGLRLVTDNLGGVILTWTSESDGSIYTCAQSYAADGTRRWQESGVNLTNLNYYTITSILPDGDNGVIFAYSSDYESNSRVYLHRYGMDGNPLWNAPVCLGDSVRTNRSGLLCQGIDCVYLTWSEYYMDSIQYLQQFSYAGIPAWPQAQALTPIGANWNASLGLHFSESDATLLMPAIHYDAGNNSNGLYLHKFSATGQAMWGDGVLVEPNFELYYDTRCVNALPDGNGGCFLTWIRASGQYWGGDLYAQRISASGAALWHPSVPLCMHPGGLVFTNLHRSGDNLWVAWASRSASIYGLRYQKLDLNGAPVLEPGGRLLYGGLNSMWTEGKITLARSTDNLILWDDDRQGDDNCQVYMQAVNPNGSFDFAPNGVPVTAFTGASQYLASAKILPNDQTVVVWYDRRTGNYGLYAQLLDANGTRLWEETGLRVALHPDSGYISSIQVSEENGAVYVVWNLQSPYQTGYLGSIRAQKIVGGQALWGENGVNLLQDPEICDSRLAGTDGRYALYSRRLTSSGAYTHVYVQRFSESDGSPETGWSPIGNQISSGSGVDVFSRQGIAMQMRPEGVFALYSESSNDLGTCVMAQLLSPDGQLLLAPTGALVLDTPNYVYPRYADFGSADFSLFWTEYPASETQRYLQRFQYAPCALWDAVLLTDDPDISLARPARLANDAFLVSWVVYDYNPQTTEPASIGYQYVSPQGEIWGAGPYGISTSHMYLHSLSATALGNRALVTWTDGSSYGGYKDEPIEHTNLWAQMVGNPTTQALDPGLIPTPDAVLYPNYPNPFNPSTTLRYRLKAPTQVDLAVYNLKGQLVKTLVRSEKQAAEHTVLWDGRDEQGREVSSGVYFYMLNAGSEAHTRKMLLLK